MPGVLPRKLPKAEPFVFFGHDEDSINSISRKKTPKAVFTVLYAQARLLRISTHGLEEVGSTSPDHDYKRSDHSSHQDGQS